MTHDWHSISKDGLELHWLLSPEQWVNWPASVTWSQVPVFGGDISGECNCQAARMCETIATESVMQRRHAKSQTWLVSGGTAPSRGRDDCDSTRQSVKETARLCAGIASESDREDWTLKPPLNVDGSRRSTPVAVSQRLPVQSSSTSSLSLWPLQRQPRAVPGGHGSIRSDYVPARPVSSHSGTGMTSNGPKLSVLCCSEEATLPVRLCLKTNELGS